MKPTITVIIPIYNVEKYLDKCLYSVRQQTLQNIEILCIDDCSPDNSYKIVEIHAAKDSRVRLIRHKINLGPGGARNTAIRSAKADYISGVDGDDQMLPNMLERLWEEAEDGNIDIICCGFNKVNEAGQLLSQHVLPPRTIVIKDTDINFFSITNPGFVNKLWRRSLYIDNNISFPERIFSEDMATTPRIISRSKKIKIIKDRLYQYCIRPGSITTTFGPKHILDYLKGFEILLGFLEENNLLKRHKKDFISYINTNMHFHSQKVLDSDTSTYQKMQYFRHLLLLKISFLDYYDLIKEKNLESLLVLLRSAQTKEDLM